MIDLTVHAVELIQFSNGLLFVFPLLAKIIFCLLDLVVCELFHKLVRHATLTGFATTSYRAWKLNKLTSESHNSMTPFKFKSDVIGLHNLLAD